MDSLTQIVLGASVGEAVLGKKVGNKAMLYGAIAGTIPDFDTFASHFTDTVTAIELHRGFTHSLIFSICFAPIFGWLIHKIEHKNVASIKDWSWLMFWGFVTHPLLDAHTTWGTQLFWPFDLRIAYKNIFVIDPLYTLPFLIFLLLAFFSKKGTQKRTNYNHLGLIISSTYMLITIGLKGYTYFKFKEALNTQKIDYTAIETKPTPFNSFLWTANIDTKNAYLIGDYSIFDTQPILFKSYPKNHHLLGELAYNDKIKRLKKISNNWFTISKNNDTLTFNDLRFGILPSNTNTTTFAFSYSLIQSNDDIIVTEIPKNRKQAKQLVTILWDRVWGN